LPAALATFLFGLPLAPYSIYMLRQTGNPVFPLYNAIFKSVYWPTVNLYDGRWGAVTSGEKLMWPIRVAYDASRTGELNVYSGRITLSVIAALVALGFWRDERLRALSLATLLAAFLWSATLTGYARYGSFAEIVGGCLFFGLWVRLWSPTNRARAPLWLMRGTAAILALAMLIQVGRATTYIMKMEWSQRPTVFEEPLHNLTDAELILRDHDFAKFLAGSDRQQLEQVGAWVESGPLTSGFQSLIRPDAPILCAYIHDYFYSEPGRQKFDDAWSAAAGKNVATLCMDDQIETCTRVLNERGIAVVETAPISMLIYSRQTQLHMQLLKLRTASQISKSE
jgi:hypothetical protein